MSVCERLKAQDWDYMLNEDRSASIGSMLPVANNLKTFLINVKICSLSNKQAFPIIVKFISPDLAQYAAQYAEQSVNAV